MASNPDFLLFEFLRTRNSQYHGALISLRERIGGWLKYTVGTFPHYTSHGVDHSDAIIVELGRLLFRDNKRPTVRALSPLEAYIVGAAAYLHDAGMVVSETEKRALLESEGWSAWLLETKRHEDWDAIQGIRSGTNPAAPGNVTARHFIADLKTRYLLAEYFRERHHTRAADVVRYRLRDLTDFGLGNSQVLETIAEICEAHGLSAAVLNDSERFPFRRDIFTETVNVRLLAILLRLGDLLDMRSERACPLLLSAASPLPTSSYPHWSQYQRIFEKAVTPDEIKITANCHTQEEYGLLEDWCRWITDEVSNAGSLLARSTRHESWKPPVATMGGSAATIQIRVDPEATFIPSKWHFELDPDAVFTRLIRDTYSSPLAFVREVLQNSLDATRCQMYLDCAEQGLDVSSCPSHVDPSIRARYPIAISLTCTTICDEVADTDRTIQILTIEDPGIGMNTEVITKYLLQVGRSYYTTAEFHRRFAFNASSRFGVGFLSVFSVSDHINLETYRPSSSSVDGPIRLTLTRPKNYLMTEVGTRNRPGTSVAIRLRDRLQCGELTEALSKMCRRVEFPIQVDDLGLSTVIETETSAAFTYDVRAGLDGSAKISVKSVPIDIPQIDGEFYIFSYCDEDGESWAHRESAILAHSRHPAASSPTFPANLRAFHGITISDRYDYQPEEMPIAIRMDYRGDQLSPTLSRDVVGDELASVNILISRRKGELVKEHLSQTPRAMGPNGWRYKQELMEALRMPLSPLDDYWRDVPATARVFQRGTAQLLSLADLEDTGKISIIAFDYRSADGVLSLRHRFGLRNNDVREPTAVEFERLTTEFHPSLTDFDIAVLYDLYFREILSAKHPVEARFRENMIVVDWESASTESLGTKLNVHGFPVWTVPFDGSEAFGFRDLGDMTILNAGHPFILWWQRLLETEGLASRMAGHHRDGVWGQIAAAAAEPWERRELIRYVTELAEVLRLVDEDKAPLESLMRL
jgi:molecular chaperone HtpG